MNFQNKYKELDNEDLSKVLAKAQDLSHPARMALSKVLDENRELILNQEDVAQLNQMVRDENQKITNLEYLKNLGFQMIKQTDALILKRRSWAKVIEVFAMIVGGILTLLLASAAATLINLILNGGATVPGTIGLIMNLIAGTAGILLFVRAMGRSLKFSGFKLTATNGELLLKFGNEVSIIKDPESAIQIQSSDNLRHLVIDANGKEYTLTSVKETNHYFVGTIESLKQMFSSPKTAMAS